jgi:hypothetical protein
MFRALISVFFFIVILVAQAALVTAAVQRSGSQAQIEYQRQPRKKRGGIDASEIDALFELLSNANLDQAAQPANVVTPLLPHQLQGLQWMKQRERACDNNELPPFWAAKSLASGQAGFFCSLSNFFTDKAPLPLTGGILVDCNIVCVVCDVCVFMYVHVSLTHRIQRATRWGWERLFSCFLW